MTSLPRSLLCQSVLLGPALLLGTAGCVSEVTTSSGVIGAPLAARSGLAIAVAPDQPGATAALAQTLVERALVQRGHALSPGASLKVEIAVAERSAPVEIDHAAGQAISATKKRHFLQRCVRTIQRLTLAVYDDVRPGVTRAWAEEHHCKGTLDQSLPALADRAVAALADPGKAGRSKRAAPN